MTTVAFLVRTGLRHRLTSFLVVALLIGVGAGSAMASWAGARRTATAYPRLLDRTNEADVQITSFGEEPIDFDAIRDAPGVQTSGGVHGYGVAVMEDGGVGFTGFFAIAPEDEVFGREVTRPVVLEGRLPDPGRAHEVLVSNDAVDAGYPLGSTIPACVFEFQEVETFEVDEREPTEAEIRSICPPFDLQVVGVGRFAFEINADEIEAIDPVVLFSPSFNRAAPKDHSYDIAGVVLADAERDFPAFQRSVLEAHPGGQMSIETRDLTERAIELSVRPYVRTLQLFAAVVALASLGILLPAMRRLVVDARTTDIALAAAGVGARERRGASIARGTILAVAGAVVAAGVAIVASRAFPIGTARVAEVEPGVRADALVLTVGISLVLLTGVGVGAIRARRAVRSLGASTSSLADGAARMGAPPTAVLGVNAAITVRPEIGRAATAGTFLGTIVSIVTVAAALSFGASLTRMLDEPARYGWTWDAALEAFESGINDDLEAMVADSPSVEAMSVVLRTSLTLDERTVVSYAVEPSKGRVEPTILSGRAPAAEDEVALGGQTLDRLGHDIGDQVTAVDADGQERVVQIVGRTLLPSLALGQRIGVGEGALFTTGGLRALAEPERGLLLLDLTPGSTPGSLRDELVAAGLPDPGGLTGPTKTGDLVSYERVDQTPLFLAGLLAVLGVGVLTHTLVASIRARRRELAVLKCIGFRGRQVAATVAWHATTLVLVCLIVGLPLGIAGGQVAWSAFARQLGVDDDPALPAAALVLLIGGAIAVANVVAAAPGLLARRIPPAVMLRRE